jgi:hypothetical protein
MPNLSKKKKRIARAGSEVGDSVGLSIDFLNIRLNGGCTDQECPLASRMSHFSMLERGANTGQVFHSDTKRATDPGADRDAVRVLISLGIPMHSIVEFRAKRLSKQG